MTTGRVGRFLGSTPAKGVYLFGLLGPPIGGLLLLVLMSFSDGNRLSASAVFSALFLFSAFSYAFGLVPAVVTGFVAGLLRQRGQLHVFYQCVYVALMGGVLSTLFGLFLPTDAGDFGPMTFLLGIPGLVGGLCCALLFRERAPRNAP